MKSCVFLCVVAALLAEVQGAATARATVKGYFDAGDRPTEANFDTSWDSVGFLQENDTVTGNWTFSGNPSFTGSPTFAGLASSAALTFTGTDHAGLRLISLTTAQRDALTPATGDQIWNTTTAQSEIYSGSSWAAVGSGGAFTDADPIVPNTTTYDLVLGTDAGANAKLEIGADADQVQFFALGNTTQTDAVGILKGGGASSANPGWLKLQTADTTVVNGDVLGRIDAQAPNEASGTDSIIVGASIYAEADATFDATTNTTDWVFAVANSGTATEVMRILGSDGSVSMAGDLSVTGAMSIGTLDVSEFLHGTTAGIAAVNPGGQGDGALTAEWNEVATVGTTNDAVTLPAAAAGKEVVIMNNGANTLEIWPASGDNLGAGVDTATTLAAGSNLTFRAYDATNWEQF